MNPLFFCFVLFLVFFQPQHVLGHGTGHAPLDQARTRAIEFNYSDDTPMQYAKVLVFSPQDPNIEHQNARTDKNGAFAFVPDSQGEWIIKASDGMGHADEAVVNVVFDTQTDTDEKVQHPSSSAETNGPITKTLKIIAGLSLILNAALGLYVVRANRNHPAPW